jgi:trimethylamine--corrinoid protein Co-methyltransferase
MRRTRPEFLSEDDLQLVHESSLRMMAGVGLAMPVPEAHTILQQHGSHVDGQRVFFSRAMVETALASAPLQFTLHARDPQRSRLVGGDSQIFAPGYGAPFIMELDGTAQPGTMALCRRF